MYLTYKDQSAINAVAGTFWNELYEPDLIRNLVAARTLSEHQVIRQLEELKLSLSRLTIPATKTQLIYPITVTNETIYVEGLTYAAIITDAILKPVHVFVYGLDFEIIENNIIFTTPLSNIACIYLHNAEFANDMLEERYGALLGLYAPASMKYQQLLNIAYDTILCGTTELAILKLLATLYDNPIAQEEEIVIGSTPTSIITDKNAYKSFNGHTISIGQQLKPGDHLFDGIFISTEHNIINCVVKVPVCRELASIDLDQLFRLIIPPYISLRFRTEV